MRLGKRLHRPAVEVDRLERFRVFGLQRAGESADARADFRFQIRFGRRLRLELTGERFDGTAGGVAPPKLVDRGIPQRAIEPGHDAFVRRRQVRAVDHLRKRILQDVLSQRPVAAAPFAARRTFSPERQNIKALAGRWEGTTFLEREGESDAVVTYEITAAGSAVIDRMFPGTVREMTTVYHDDSSGRLMATHYCNAANQPRLRLQESDGERLYFVFSPDSDIQADLEGHAHELTLRLGADGSLTHDWLNHYLGKPAAERNITLTRGK